MSYTYKTHLKEPDALPLEKMEKILEDLCLATDINDTTAKELYEDLIKSMIEYAAVRARWTTFYSREERIEKIKEEQCCTMK